MLFRTFGYLAAGFRWALMGLAGLLPVLLMGVTILLWQRGMASEGDIVASGAIAIRIAQMTGWVSFTLMAIYSNIGEVEDGMRTLTPRVRLDDEPDAQELVVHAGEIELRDLGFAYGRQKGGIERISLTIKPGEKLGIVGASGAGKSTLVALLPSRRASRGEPRSTDLTIFGILPMMRQSPLRSGMAPVIRSRSLVVTCTEPSVVATPLAESRSSNCRSICYASHSTMANPNTPVRTY